jgi:hypothetical protein
MISSAALMPPTRADSVNVSADVANSVHANVIWVTSVVTPASRGALPGWDLMLGRR